MNEAKCLRNDSRYPFAMKKSKAGIACPPCCLVLVGLENDGCQRGVALNALWRADTSVLGTESAFKEVVQVILDAGRRLCRIVIQVVDVDVAQLVCFRKTFRQQVFIGIIFWSLRRRKSSFARQACGCSCWRCSD